MTTAELGAAAAGLVVGAGSALVLVRMVTAAPNQRLVRTNVGGRRVAAVLGGPLVLGGLNGLFVAALVLQQIDEPGGALIRVGLAVALLLVASGLGGYADDLRGDEPSRGFGGHLRAVASGRLTGGAIKVLAVGLAGAAAAFCLGGESVTLRLVLECVLLVALGANLMNLFDRAPGRTGKVALLAVAVLIFTAADSWVVASAGTVGALLVLLPVDLREQGMLGDAGANPLGAVVGLGFVLSDEPVRLAGIAVLLALNVASEFWSFSRAIERFAPLRALDDLGRRRPHPDE